MHTYIRMCMYVCTYVLYGVSDCVYECVRAFVYNLLLHASTCRYIRTCVTALESKISYTAKFLRGKTFAVGIEKDRSRENFHGSSIFQ